MPEKFESFLIVTLPIIAAFNYVVAHRVIGEAMAADDTRLYEEFYYIVVATGLFHFLWLINMILVCMGAFTQVRYWRILTSFLVFQTVLIFSLAVYMSLFLCAQVYFRDVGIYSSNRQYFITWSAVSVGCDWFLFLVLIMLILKHIYKHAQVTAVRIEDQSRV